MTGIAKQDRLFDAAGNITKAQLHLDDVQAWMKLFEHGVKGFDVKKHVGLIGFMLADESDDTIQMVPISDALFLEFIRIAREMSEDAFSKACNDLGLAREDLVTAAESDDD